MDAAFLLERLLTAYVENEAAKISHHSDCYYDVDAGSFSLIDCSEQGCSLPSARIFLWPQCEIAWNSLLFCLAEFQHQNREANDRLEVIARQPSVSIRRQLKPARETDATLRKLNKEEHDRKIRLVLDRLADMGWRQNDPSSCSVDYPASCLIPDEWYDRREEKVWTTSSIEVRCVHGSLFWRLLGSLLDL